MGTGEMGGGGELSRGDGRKQRGKKQILLPSTQYDLVQAATDKSGHKYLSTRTAKRLQRDLTIEQQERKVVHLTASAARINKRLCSAYTGPSPTILQLFSLGYIYLHDHEKASIVKNAKKVVPIQKLPSLINSEYSFIWYNIKSIPSTPVPATATAQLCSAKQ
nr:hypothetical protein Iba_chr11aCG15720 [Ipomoea batatas]